MNAPTEHWSGPIREHPGGGGMSVKSLLGMAMAILVSLALLATAGFFYVAIQRDEMVTAQCMRAVESIRTTQMLAAQWSVEVGKVKNEVNSNFDVLADFIDRMSPHIQVIHDSQSAMPNLPSDIKWALNGYVQRLKAREERIERFKSGFAIVRNSRRFIPREGEVLAEAARDGGYGKVEVATQQVLKGVQNFLRQPTEVQHQRMEQAARTLAESAGGTPLRTQAETLNKHVRALLRHHGLTEQRFEDVMRTDLEDRAGQVIGLLDADHQQSRTKRRYFDYGFWASLGLAVFYWSTLIVRWMSRRRQRKTAARAQEVPPAEGTPSPWGMDAALATAGGPGFPLEDAQEPGRAGGKEHPVQTRRAQTPGRGTSAEGVSGSGRTGPTLEERLKARDEARRAQPEAPARADAREQGAAVPETRDTLAGKGGDTSASDGAGPSLEERLKALKAELEAQRAQQRRESVHEDVQGQGAPWEIPVTEGQDVPASEDGEERLKAEAEARREAEAQRAQREAEAQRAQREAEAQRAQREAEAQRAQREAEAQRAQREAEAQRAQREAEAQRAQREAEAQQAQREAEAQQAQREAEAQQAQREAEAQQAQREAEAQQAQREAEAQQAQREAEAQQAQREAEAQQAQREAEAQQAQREAEAQQAQREAEEAQWAMRAEPLSEDAREEGAAVSERQDVPVGEDGDAFPSVRTSPVLEERLQALRRGVEARQTQEPVHADRGKGAAVTDGERVQAPADSDTDRVPAMAKEDAPSAGWIRADSRPPQTQIRARAAESETETAAARVRTGEPEDGMPGAAREPAGRVDGTIPGMRRRTEPEADAVAGEYRAQERAAHGRPPVSLPDPASAPDGVPGRSGGEELRLRGQEAEETPAPPQPAGSEFVHQATREAMLDRLREVEQEIRAAADAAEQAERAWRNADGEEHQDDGAWAAAAGRMAGARWAVHTLLREVDRLPVAPAPRGLPGQVDMRALLKKQLSALPGEDRKRIDATLVPGAVTRGNPRALETAMDLIVQHALEGARLHPGGKGYVTLTLVQENDGVHLTCLDHGPESEGSGERRSLALAVARGLIEGQDGEMEITPYPRHGTMVRLRLPPARSPVGR